MLTSRNRFRHLVWLSGLLLQPIIASAGVPVYLVFEGGVPEFTGDATLRWGVVYQGIERGRGEITPADITPGEDRATAAVEAELDGIDGTDQGEPILRLCIDHDAWHSYNASFGDRFQVVPLERRAGRWTATVRRDVWQRRKLSSSDSALTVYYHRFDADYKDASLWTWDEHFKRAPGANEMYPVGRDDYGIVFQVDTALYGKPGDKVGLLPRRRADWNLKDPPDRFWSPAMGAEVFLVQSDGRVHTTKPDVRPRILAARLDALRRVTVRFTHRLPVADWSGTSFKLLDETGHGIGILHVKPIDSSDGRSAGYALTTALPVRFSEHRYTLDAGALGRKEVLPGRILEDPNLFYDPHTPLGAAVSPERTTFHVFAPTAGAMHVVIADEVEGKKGRKSHKMAPAGKGVWKATVEDDLRGRYYAYLPQGPGYEGAAEVVDPYARCTQGRATRALLVDLKSTDPPGFRDRTFERPASPTDAIIYEMHVRDFTIAPDSGVQQKGKYLGLTEGGTHLSGEEAIRTGIDHLVELGVTHVQLMPIQDFDNHEQRQDAYNWGYMPVHFNAPDGWYATRVLGPARISECKRMIQALHARGIGVIMDVVYNHTAGIASFERLVPGYYFRLTPDGKFSNGSGCGNEFKSENPMARRFILDSVKYWVNEYQVDGFRFDLMGLMDRETMMRIREELSAIDPGILVYGEPWTGGATTLSPITGKHEVRGTGIGAFNDHFRDAIKGEREGPEPGYIQVGHRRDGVVKGLAGSIHDWTTHPSDTLNYFEAHDDLTAWDKLLLSTPGKSAETRRRMIRLAALVLLTAQGTPFIHSGQEFCRTKQGSNNSYNLPDAINQIDWSLKKRNHDVFAWHQGLIAFRKAHPLLRLRTRDQVEKRVSFPDSPHPQAVVYRIDGRGLRGEELDELRVLLNGSPDDVTFTFPPGMWRLYADGEQAAATPLRTVEGTLTVPGHSGALLAR